MELHGFIVLALLTYAAAVNTRLKEVFSWKTVEFEFPKSSDRAEAITSGSFVPENNLPLGLDVWRDKLFVTVPRWKNGVVSSLNFIDISDLEIPIGSDEDLGEEPTPLIELGTSGELYEPFEPEDAEEPDNEDEEDLDEDEGDDGPIDGVLDTVGDATAPVTDLVGGLLGGGSDEDGALDGVLDTVGDATAPVTDLVGGLLGGASGEDGPLDGALDTVGDAAAPVTDLVGGLVGGGSDEDGPLDGALDTVGDAAAPVTDLVGGLLGGGSDEDGPVDGALDTVGDAAAPVTDLLGGGSGEDGPVDDVLDTVGDATAPVNDLVGGLTGGGSDEDGPLDGALDTVGDATAPVTDLVGGLGDVLPGGDEADDSLPGEEEDPTEISTEAEAEEEDGNEEENDEEENGEEEEDYENEDGEEETDEDTEDSEEEISEEGDDEVVDGRNLQKKEKTVGSLGKKKYQVVRHLEKRSISLCQEGDKECEETANETETLVRKSGKKSKKSRKSNTGGIVKKSNTLKMEKTKKTKTKQTTKKSKKVEEIAVEIPMNKNPRKPLNRVPSKNSNNEKKKGAKQADSSKKVKKNKGSKAVATKEETVELTCRDGVDNICGRPIQAPLYAEVSFTPKVPKKNESGKKKPKSKKNCKKTKKTKKPEKAKKPCVKPAKVSATSPALIPYPDLATNTPTKDTKDGKTKITSVFRIRIDACDRLWAMDTGIADILGNTIEYSKPQILVYDLLSDELVRKYEFKADDVEGHSFFANIIVDVDKDKCDDAFAYVPDLGSYAMNVYSFKSDKSWRIKHHYFNFNPLAGDYNVGGVNFQWTDGVFGVALTRPNEDGSKTAYFHALSSTSQFKTNTKVLQDPNEGKMSNYTAYTLVGDKGENSQTSASFIHEPTGVLFYTQVNKDAVYCWNTDKDFTPENLQEVASDPETLIFPNDLKVDYKNNLWVLTDKLPVFVTKGLDSKEVNYRIFVAPVSEAIKDTNCAP